MNVSLDLEGSRVIIVGAESATRRVRARYQAAGAEVTVLSAGRARVSLASAAGIGTIPGGLPGDEAAGRSAMPHLIVWVEGRESQRIDLLSAARRLRVSMTTEHPAAHLPRGSVTLVGGGPGELDLITVAGRQALLEADVVLYDRLAPTEILAAWAPAAELIDVGKAPGHHAVPQQEIEAIIVERALRGLAVVRLKGGDPFVFGRGGEEVQACRDNQIPVTVVPGVTSAISVPAAAGIPVTHRNVSRAFTVISGHAPLSPDELTHLSGLGSTIVLLMGVGTLVQTVAGLQTHGMRSSMPLAIVERGYSIHQRTTFSTVGEITSHLAAISLRSPAVIIIGEVVRLASGETPNQGAVDLIVNSLPAP
ncbi:uroporphyrinogen-III C-methyltransferase [Subtercola vilae]|uniref:uroporphyrinogen-III C-methyltransferase n=1 Tax=Subtercola vilae TaxID=2056433 RepID=A0A4T2C912_9MICO|nr:uroporphyrinogen-III C-methyltransferase [Subtercola vilae]TIH40132.1 uroporphyrinogen-III C-methyltransferase [Subtercola vilae]